MKNKKNIIIYIITVITVIIVIGIYVYNDYTRVIENVSTYSTDAKWAYSLKDSENEVIFTLYQRIQPYVKNVTVYKIENNIVSDITYEQHYINKLNALHESKQKMINATNITSKDNIVYYKPIRSGDIGITKEELINNLVVLENIYIKVIE